MKQTTANLSRESILSEWKDIQDNSEASLRQQLAALYRIIDNNGWADVILTHCSVRLPGEDAYLFIPFGLMFNEINADNIIKVWFTGEIDSPCGFPINVNGSRAHTAIYKNRRDVNCIIHTHSNNGVAFSNSKKQLLCLDQTTMFLHNAVGYHEFNTLFINDREQKQLVADLSNHKCVVLRNHGLLAIGESVPLAFWNYYFLERACGTELQLLSAGIDISNPDNKIKDEVSAQYAFWNTSENGYPGSADLLFLAEKRRLKLSV